MSTRTDARNSSAVPVLASPARLRIQILGELRVWHDSRSVDPGPRQQRCLLALLLARAGQPVGLGEMVDLLWDGDPPASAVNIIHKYVGSLRRLMEPRLGARAASSWLVRHGNGYRFVADPGSLDLLDFRRSVERARSAGRAGQETRALELYERGLGRWTGPCATGLAESSSVAAIFTAVDQQLFDVVLEAADLAVRLGRPGRLLDLTRRAAAWAPMNEPLHARLVRLLGESGRPEEARAVFDALRDRLVENLGLDPGPELRQAWQDVRPEATPGPPSAAAEPLVRPAQLPPDLPIFVGREAETAFVEGLYDSQRAQGRPGPLVVALSGMGGVGKSTLAVHLAHRMSPRYRDGQLSLDLRGLDGDAVSTREALEVLLRSLGVPADSVPDRPDAQVGLYRSLTAGRSLIVLLDNARDAQQVRPLIPNSGDSLVVVTSRTPLSGLAAGEGAGLLTVGLPSVENAREIIGSRLRFLPVPPPLAVVDDIVEGCGRLPLALALVAARVAARPQLSLEAVAAQLRPRSTRLEAFGRDSELTGPRGVFSWSYRLLAPEPARLFRLLSLALGPSISAAACASLLGAAPGTTRMFLDELTEAALIAEVAPGRYGFHVLVRAYAEELLLATETAAEREAAGTRLLQHYLHSGYACQIAVRPHHPLIEPPPAAPGVVPENRPDRDTAMAWFAQERQVLLAAVHRATDPRYGVRPWMLALIMQQHLQWAGFFHDWRQVTRTALAAARRDGDRLGQALTLRCLAGASYCFGDYGESLAGLTEARDILTGLGRTGELAFVHTNLGTVLGRLGRYEECLSSHQAALYLYRLSGDPCREVRALSETGLALSLLGRCEEAARQLQQALARNAEAGHPEQEGQIRCYLARTRRAQGELREAVAQLERAVTVLREVGHRTMEIDALLLLAKTWLELDRPGEARQAWQAATEIFSGFQNGGTGVISARLERIETRLRER